MMDGFSSGQRPYGWGAFGDRRVQRVSGSSAARPPHAFDLPPRTSWTGHGPGTAATAKFWGFTDPETRRKKRIARYKAYGAGGRVKASLRRGIRWVKDKCSQIVHGC